MNNRPTGTVTFLFTDIEGSTKLAREYPNTWEDLRARHHAILRSAIEAQDGYVFQIIGDAFCAAFHTAGDALRAALQAQRGLYAEQWGNTPVRVRMGIHSGKAEIQADGQYLGYAALSRVQRVSSAGHGGQTLLSQAAQELVRDDLPEDIRLRDLGERRLKDMSQPEHIFQVDMPGQPSEFPALKTLDVQLNNLPAQLTAFIGREREIAAVAGLLRSPDVRLVTLTGAGGTGKTRLSLQVAAEVLDEYEHGAWFVELAAISEPGLVLPTIASTFKVRESTGTSLEQALIDYLAKRQLLLVIDNFEQVVSAAGLIGRLLAGAPRVRVLVSSREVLHLRAEHDYPVPPLGLPESKRRQSAAVLAQYEAVALFIQHARAANPAFEMNEQNAASVAEICVRLDGLPLAIELAAARSRLLKPSVMLDKLKSRLNLLTGGARDLPQRQQTIRGAIDWSYELLDEGEKVLFARLGVFIGGWTIESAEVVCSAGLSIDVLGGLESLLDKSLLRQFVGVSGDTRFSMLETVREYAFEKLVQSGELPVLQQAHASYMEGLLHTVRSATNGPEEVKWFARLDDELDNLRSAVEWAFVNHQSVFIFRAIGLDDYWYRRAISFEPLGWLERAPAGGVDEADDAQTERAWALKSAGHLSFALGNDTQRARAYSEAALDLFRRINDLDGITRTLNSLGDVELKYKNFEKARLFYEGSLVIQEEDTFGKSMTYLNLGNLERIGGDWEKARLDFLHARAICERLGSESGVSFACFYLGKLATMQRQLDQALAYFETYVNAGWAWAHPLSKTLIEGLPGYVHLLDGSTKEARKLINASIQAIAEFANLNPNRDFFEFWMVLEGKARLALMDGYAERAAVIFGANWTWREKDDCALTPAERPDYEAAIAEARAAIGDSAFEQAFARGRAMTGTDAILFAMDPT